ADGVDGDLQPSAIRADNIVAQFAQRSNVDAGAAGLVLVGLEHLCRAGAERTVDEILQATDLHPQIAKADHDADLGQAAPGAEGKMKANAQGQLAALGQLLQKAQKPRAYGRAAAVHVLHAGDSEAARFAAS